MTSARDPKWPSMRSRATRFVVSAETGNVDDDDFNYDVLIRVEGDFPTMRQKAAYARAVAKALNAMPPPTGHKP